MVLTVVQTLVPWYQGSLAVGTFILRCLLICFQRFRNGRNLNSGVALQNIKQLLDYAATNPDAERLACGYTSGFGTTKSSSQPNASLTTLEDKPL